jgi:hypothetical protein
LLEYYIYISDEFVDSISANSTSYSYTAVEHGNWYNFTISVVNQLGEGLKSTHNVIFAPTFPDSLSSAPAKLSADATHISVSWGAP